MKILLYLLILSFNNLNQDDNYIAVFPNFTEKELVEIELKVKIEYKNIAKINVLKRDEKGKIIQLKLERFDINGRELSSCSSDDFKELRIKPTGCYIADNIR